MGKGASVCCIDQLSLVVTMDDVVRVVENPCLKAGEGVFEVGSKTCVEDMFRTDSQY